MKVAFIHFFFIYIISLNVRIGSETAAEGSDQCVRVNENQLYPPKPEILC